MRNSALFFPKLAAGNLRKNRKSYLPYLLSGMLFAAVYYILRSLSLNPDVLRGFGGGTMHAFLQMGADAAAVFIIIFLLYTNSFLMKQRKKEFALLNTLGMDKRHMIRILAFESLYAFLIISLGGLVLGILLDKFAFLVISKVVDSTNVMGFFIAKGAVGHELLLFAAAIFLVFLKSAWTLQRLNPAELLRESKAGEKEPKAKWALAILGVLMLGGGYLLALTAENPITAIPAFFFAVLLVIFGTFLLFTAGSIALLKLLKRNRKFYYKTNHFVSVSGLMYRMKQNAAGLASICILSTMVLVMISSTSSLMVGKEATLRMRYPHDFTFEISETDAARRAALTAEIENLQKKENIQATAKQVYRYVAFPGARQQDGFAADKSSMAQNILLFIPLPDYNAAVGTAETLQDGEVLLHCERLDWKAPEISVLGQKFKVKAHTDRYPANGQATSYIGDFLYLVCTEADYARLNEAQHTAYAEAASEERFYYAFDTDAGEAAQNNFRTDIYKLHERYEFSYECRLAEAKYLNGMFSGFFFIGIFLGILFTAATVLIIYYKQISEGYDDKDRFEILQKVGMSQKEVKQTIHAQVLTVFFLPLCFAGMHLAVAFPILKKLLAMFGMLQTNLFLGAVLISFTAFAILYIGIYAWTAGTYYKIVRR